MPGRAAPGSYTVTNLVSDLPGVAQERDPNQVNPWGAALTATPVSPLFVADQGRGVISRKSGAVGGTPLIGDGIVSLPDGNPTSVVFHPFVLSSPNDFVISNGDGHQQAAAALFATLGGQIDGWNSGVGGNGSASSKGFRATSVPGASFTGLALAGITLYAADFAHGRIDVFSSKFQLVTRPGAFTDRSIPRVFRPFNVQNIGGNIYVTYALANPVTGQAVSARGAGFVDVFPSAGCSGSA